MNKDEQDSILKAIALQGALESPTIQPIIANKPEQVLELGKGLPRIKRSLSSNFKLILSQPTILQAMSSLSIRCVLCKQIIRYPAWYCSQRYSVNWFHYFICFDAHSPTRPSARCYRR